MSTTQIEVTRFNVTSSKTFEAVVSDLHAAVRHPYLNALEPAMKGTETYTDFETLIQAVVGSSGLMEFMRFDQGDILRKKHGGRSPESIRLIVGNPLVMARLVELVPDAGSYAPITILVDERSDGVHISYDEMVGLLAPYRNEQASSVAHDLDVKVRALLNAAAN